MPREVGRRQLTRGRRLALGAVQGVAEVVPVSSSAQLSLLPWLRGWEQPPDRTTFAAGLHLGSALGLGWALRRELRTVTVSRLVLVSAPAAVAGLVGQDAVERRLGRPGPTAALLAGAGLLLLAADRRPQDRRVDGTALAAAGLVQVAALAPGVSRSGATLTALRALRAGRADALRTSLVMSLPVTAGAAALTAVRARRAPEPGPSAVAALSAVGTWALVRRHPGTAVTASSVYRLGLAAAVAARLRKEQR